MKNMISRILIMSSLVALTACGGGGGGGTSTTTSTTPSTTLSKPTDVKALTGDAQVTVSWSAVTDATVYTVYWNTTGSVTTSDTSIDAGAATQLVHSSLSKGKTYYYKVTASTTSEESALSNGISSSQSAWQWSNPSPLGDTMRSSASDGTNVIAVGDYGAILLSSDAGINWTSQISGTTKQLLSIAWNGSKFVAAGQSGTILTSSNGVNWTAVQTDQASDSYTDVIAVGSQFAIIGSGGIALTSTDGESWTSHDTGVPDYFESIAWTGTQFVVVGYSGSSSTDAVYTSSDNGTTWVAQNSGNDNWLEGIAWNGSQFIAVGQLGTILSSPDGITWTSQAIPAGLSQPHLRDVIWDGSQFVAVGSGNSDVGVIIVSTDGITWTSKTSNTDNPIYSVTSHASQFVAMGKDLITGTDSSTWVKRNTDTIEAISDIAWRSPSFAAVSLSGNVLSSTDGITWSSVNITASQLSDIASDGSNFVAVGDNGTIYYSDNNGTTWYNRTISTTNDFSAVASNGAGQYVAVGGNIGSSSAGLIRTSDDNGATWTNNDNLGLAWRDVTWNGSKYAAVSSNGEIITSTDGATWTTVVIGTGNSYIFTAITSSGDSNNFVAVGQNTSGDILSSDDNGVTWTARTSSVNSGFSSVAWNGSQFMASGIGALITSPDGITWTAQNTFTGNNITGIAWDGSQYVAVGNNGTIVRGGI